MDDKSYQIIFETLAASQFTSRLQLKLLTSDQVDCLQCSYVNRKFKTCIHTKIPVPNFYRILFWSGALVTFVQ